MSASPVYIFANSGARVRITGPVHGPNSSHVLVKRVDTGYEMTVRRDQLVLEEKFPALEDLAQRIDNGGFIDVSISGAVVVALRRADMQSRALEDLVRQMTEYAEGQAAEARLASAHDAAAAYGDVLRRLRGIL